MLTSEFVTLKDGIVLPVEVLTLAWRLEAEGFHFEVFGETLRLCRSDGVPSAERLTAEDRAAIVKWKPHLLLVANLGENEARTTPGRSR